MLLSIQTPSVNSTDSPSGSSAPVTRPAAMPMDAGREGEEFVVEFDLPGVEGDFH